VRRLAITLGILLAAAGWAFADPDAGVGTWRQLGRDLVSAEERVTVLRVEIAKLQDQIDALEGDELAIESAIRTDLGLARAGETVVRVVRHAQDEADAP
jgi:cell division protein FtsB